MVQWFGADFTLRPRRDVTENGHHGYNMCCYGTAPEDRVKSTYISTEIRTNLRLTTVKSASFLWWRFLYQSYGCWEVLCDSFLLFFYLVYVELQPKDWLSYDWMMSEAAKHPRDWNVLNHGGNSINRSMMDKRPYYLYIKRLTGYWTLNCM